MRVLVFGNSGSGKSTYARALAEERDLEHLDLDTIVWEPRKIAVQRSREAMMATLGEFLDSNTAWVVEGCYANLIEAASDRCTQLVFLNPGLEACLANNLRRPWEPEKYESLEKQNAMLENLQAWVESYYGRDDECSYEAHRGVFDSFRGAKVEHVSTPDTSQANESV